MTPSRFRESAQRPGALASSFITPKSQLRGPGTPEISGVLLLNPLDIFNSKTGLICRSHEGTGAIRFVKHSVNGNDGRLNVSVNILG